MLLNHTDVVPVQQEFWDEEPFSGHIKDGYIWGRGTLDMKGLGIALMTFITLKRMAVPLARDVVFFAQADEEAGSEFGMRFIEREFPETLDAEYVINEGGGGTTEVFRVERPVYSIAVAEKGPLWLRLVAEGRPGHGSVPHEQRARPAGASDVPHPGVGTSPDGGAGAGRVFRAAEPGGCVQGRRDRGRAEGRRRDPRIRALLSNTISATTASSGIKHNVIPARAEAALSTSGCSPGVKPEDFEAELAAVINDPKVSLERVHVGWSDTNPHDTELFRVMEEVIHDVEDAVVGPGMTVGFTDSSVLRNRGMISLRVLGRADHPEIARGVHGHNERVSLEVIRVELPDGLGTDAADVLHFAHPP